MQTSDDPVLGDERELGSQQQLDEWAHEYRLTEILRRLAEGVPVTREDVIQLCIGCGIDKRNVF